MKYRCLLWVGLFMVLHAEAQVPYPDAPLSPANINRVEYFFNVDPGFGNGINLPVTAQVDINALATTLNISSAPNGFNQLFLRGRNAAGLWSHTAQLTLVKLDQAPYPVTVLPTPNLIRAEYFIGNDPGLGNGTPTPLVAQTNIADQAVLVNLNELPVGFYQIGIRTLNAQGQWSHTYLRDFVKIDVAPYPSGPDAETNVVAAEYFLNTDPGLGKAQPLNIGNAGNLQNVNAIIDLVGLPAGIHTLGVRTRNSNGVWSLSHLSIFTNNTPATYPTAPAPATALQQLEYFIDTDPGFGNGISIPFTPGTDVQNINVTVNLTSVTDGQHTLFIRSRNNPYSLTNMVMFVKGEALPLTWLYVKGEVRADGNHIEWATANEVNTRDFAIEYSRDGVKFDVLGTQPAAGNSQQPRNYRFIHQTPKAGVQYYRIRQNDLDGAFSYSKVVVLLNRGQLKSALLVPNPAQQQTVLVLPQAATSDGMVRLLDATGRSVLHVPFAAGAQQVVLDLRALPAGSYRVLWPSVSAIEVQQLIKQ